MARLAPIQNSFAAGELSPLMYGRSDLEGYQQGLAELRNMYANTRGPAVRRPGFRHVMRAAGNDGRIFTLQVTANLFYAGLLTDQKLSIVTPFGSTPSENFVINPRFDLLGKHWSVATAGDDSEVIFRRHLCRLYSDDQNNTYARISQQVTITTPANTHAVEVNTGGTGQYQILIGTSEGAGDILTRTTSQINARYTFTPPGDTFWVTVQTTNDTAPKQTVYVFFVGIVDDTTPPVEFVTPWPEEELHAVHFIPYPDGQAIYMTHPRYPVQKLTYDPATETLDFQEVTFTSPPPEWVGDNWPATGTYFQGRLWLAATPDRPQTFWASKSGMPEDFTQGDLDDEGLEFTLQRFGKIQWMYGARDLLIGAEYAEFRVKAQQGVITPSDIQVDQQSAYGSANVQAEQVGDQVFYVSADQTKLRALQWDDNTLAYMSRDITYASQHITRPRIIETVWAQNPDNLFWCVLNDGDMACCTYERSENIYGWHRHDTQGEFKSAAVGTILGVSILMVVTQRVSGQIDVEQQTLARYMDGLLDLDAGGNEYVDGLDHLEGMTVQVLTDGAVHPDRVVGAESEPGAGDGMPGRIYLQWPATRVDAGLGYVSRMQTLPFDRGSPAGSGKSAMKHRHRIFVRVLDSAKPIVNDVRPATRYPATPMDTREPNRTEDFHVANLGRDRHAFVKVEQDLPLALTVVAIFGEMGQEML